MNSQCRKFAFYFPQFYSTPENDLHWGKGFTDWDNVKSSIPQFDGHRQPRVPLDGYYDQSDMSTIVRQVTLAKKYNLDGFSFYHYWFDGKLTLEKPVDNFLKNKDLDMSFSLTWANETWSKRWVGDDRTIIFEQTHSNDKTIWKAHFDYLINFWLDRRYEKLNGKPIFNIYNPHLLKNSASMFDYWTRLAVERGLPGIHFVAIVVSPTFSGSMLDNYEGVLDFQPRYSTNKINVSNSFISTWIDKLRFLPEPILNVLTSIRHKFSKVDLIDYQKIWDNIIASVDDEKLITDKKRYYGAFVDWDNTARYKNKGKVYLGASPHSFQMNLKNLVDKLDSKDIVYINAWNEWSEGTYLEPDEHHQYAYLDVIKNL